MKKIINYLKNDFIKVRFYLGLQFNREIPFGIALLYYVVVGIIVLPLVPFAWIGTRIWIFYIKRQMKKEGWL